MLHHPRRLSASGPHAEPAPPRPPRPLKEPVLQFDLAMEADGLRREGPWLEHGSNAVTLVKHADLRIVFMLLQRGTRIAEHHAGSQLSVHTLTGRVRLHLAERTVDLPAGHLLALDRDVAHDVEATEESTVLLTIAWPSLPRNAEEASSGH